MGIHHRMARGLERRLRGERRRVERGIGRRRTDDEPNRGWRPAVLIALAIASVDWAVKWLVIQRLPLHSMEVIWDGRLAFWHVRNPAMILGLYGNLPLEGRVAIALVSAVVGLLLLFQVVSRGHRLAPRRRKWAWLFAGLASGGMLGNLGERAIHWGVTDYLSIRWGGLWLPPGNVADLSIILSLPVAVAVVCFELESRARRAALPAESSAPSVLGG